MKTLADFKNWLKIGNKLHTTFHKEFAGRDENKQVIYGNKDLGIREVSIVQSNSFALKTKQSDGKEVDSWCQYPKAKECKINGDSITIFGEDGLPVLTYTIM